MYRSQSFRDISKGFAEFGLKKKSKKDVFRECFDIIRTTELSENDWHSILVSSLKDIEVNEADTCLAELISAGYFNVVVTLNIDSLIEKSLDRIGKKETQDYLIASGEKLRKLVPGYSGEANVRNIIVKVFGDLDARDYQLVKPEFNLDRDGNLKQYLEEVLSRDVIVIGFDSLWDKPLIRAFPTRGSSVWFVNEEELDKESLLLDVIERRNGSRYIVGDNGDYISFIKELHWALFKRPPDVYYTTRDILNQLHSMKSQLDFIQSEVAVIVNKLKDQ